MCRLLGAVTAAERALIDVFPAEIESFSAQAEVHRDGWGVTWYTGEDLHIRRGTGRADREPEYSAAIREARSTLTAVHLRKASVGLPVELVNCHPFREGKVSFMHNGQFQFDARLREGILARGGRQPEGTTDSELFFSLVTVHAQGQEGEEIDWPLALQRAAAEVTELCLAHGYRPPESMNALLTTPAQVVAYAQSDPSQAQPHHAPDNYTLRYRATADSVLVMSSGLPQEHWAELGQGEALVIDRATRAVERRAALPGAAERAVSDGPPLPRDPIFGP